MITPGTDAETGDPIYPHRSIRLTYKVDCAANRLAMSEWQMFDGNLAQGQVIRDQKNVNGVASNGVIHVIDTVIIPN